MHSTPFPNNYSAVSPLEPVISTALATTTMALSVMALRSEELP
jgi:hypothetical protein